MTRSVRENFNPIDVPFPKGALKIFFDSRSDGSRSAAAQNVAPLSDKKVSTGPRKFVNLEKASKKLFKSKQVTSSTCMQRVHKQVKSNPHAYTRCEPGEKRKAHNNQHRKI